MGNNQKIIKSLSRIRDLLAPFAELHASCGKAIYEMKHNKPAEMGIKIINGEGHPCCPDCLELIDERYKYCPKCGLAVKPRELL